jgi:hypothetical protein
LLEGATNDVDSYSIGVELLGAAVDVSIWELEKPDADEKLEAAAEYGFVLDEDDDNPVKMVEGSNELLSANVILDGAAKELANVEEGLAVGELYSIGSDVEV